MTNLETYKQLNKVQKTIWAYITTFFLEENSLEDAKKGFLALDKNNDGTLAPKKPELKPKVKKTGIFEEIR